MRPLTVKKAKKFGRVAVLMGGVSAEKEISINSGTAVLESLVKQRVDAVAIDIADNLVAALNGKSIDRVFNIIHGRGGEDGVVQSVLETLNIPYTGSGVMASALTMDKLRTKLCWKGYGLMTPDWFELTGEDDIESCIKALGFPVIVKPSLEGSSLGMSVANDRDELVIAMNKAAEYHCDVFAEAWVEGDEYTVAILGGEALPIIRLETPNIIYDYSAKYQLNSTQYHCPCGLSQATENELQKVALEACKVAGVKGWGRVDLFVDKSNNIQLIEVNTVPGMTDHSLVPMAAKADAIEFDELVWRILETSLNN